MVAIDVAKRRVAQLRRAPPHKAPHVAHERLVRVGIANRDDATRALRRLVAVYVRRVGQGERAAQRVVARPRLRVDKIDHLAQYVATALVMHELLKRDGQELLAAELLSEAAVVEPRVLPLARRTHRAGERAGEEGEGPRDSSGLPRAIGAWPSRGKECPRGQDRSTGGQHH